MEVQFEVPPEDQFDDMAEELALTRKFAGIL